MEDYDEVMAEMLDQGILEVAGIDEEDGQFLLQLGPNAQELAPELYEAWVGDIDEDLMSLYQKGLIDIEYDEELNVSFGLTEKGKELYEPDEPL